VSTLALRRGKRAGISLVVDELPLGWAISCSGHGRGTFAALLPRCTGVHAGRVCIADKPGGYHEFDVPVFVGKLLASYGCTARRRPTYVQREVAPGAVERDLAA
jgi:hypothetical protein